MSIYSDLNENLIQQIAIDHAAAAAIAFCVKTHNEYAPDKVSIIAEIIENAILAASNDGRTPATPQARAQRHAAGAAQQFNSLINKKPSEGEIHTILMETITPAIAQALSQMNIHAESTPTHISRFAVLKDVFIGRIVRLLQNWSTLR